MIRMMLAATTVAVLAAASPAAAAGRTKLTLIYMADAGYAAAVVLRCGPVGGSHPKGRQACATLKKVGGRPERLTAPPGAMCTMEYAPITAEITGTWKGRTVNWSRKFPNTCDMTRTTGVLFVF
jgi:subtilisin inhibitor-like